MKLSFPRMGFEGAAACPAFVGSWMKMRVPLWFAGVVVLLVLSVFASAQQTTGSIRGQIVDGAGSPIAGAHIRAEELETGMVREAISGRSGLYTFTLLPVGHYQLRIAARGFQSGVPKTLALNVGDTLTIDAQLRVQELQQNVTVAASGAQLDLANTSIGQTVGRQQIATLPLNGRDFTQLGLLQPGVAPVTPGVLQASGGLRDGRPTRSMVSDRNRTTS